MVDALRTRLGLELNKTAATIDPNNFNASRAEAQSLAMATMVVGESLAALRTVGELLAGLGGGNIGLGELSKVIKQIKRTTSADPGAGARLQRLLGLPVSVQRGVVTHYYQVTESRLLDPLNQGYAAFIMRLRDNDFVETTVVQGALRFGQPAAGLYVSPTRQSAAAGPERARCQRLPACGRRGSAAGRH